MNLRNIAHALGGDVTGRNSINAPGPNHGPADRSLAIVFDSRAPAGFIVYSHAGNDPLECRDHVRTRLGLELWGSNAKGPCIPIVVSDAGPDASKARNKEFALKIWSQSIDPRNTIVEHYLREHRGLPLSDDIAGTVIRYHRGLHFDGVIVPGMVCLFRNILTDEPCGIHRTFLRSDDGQKIDRRMLGIAKAAAIKLDAHAAISTGADHRGGRRDSAGEPCGGLWSGLGARLKRRSRQLHGAAQPL